MSLPLFGIAILFGRHLLMMHVAVVVVGKREQEEVETSLHTHPVHYIKIDSTDLNPSSYSPTFFFTRLMTGGLLQTEDQPCDSMLSAYHTALGADMGRKTSPL